MTLFQINRCYKLQTMTIIRKEKNNGTFENITQKAHVLHSCVPVKLENGPVLLRVAVLVN